MWGGHGDLRLRDSPQPGTATRSGPQARLLYSVLETRSCCFASHHRLAGCRQSDLGVCTDLGHEQPDVNMTGMAALAASAPHIQAAAVGQKGKKNRHQVWRGRR